MVDDIVPSDEGKRAPLAQRKPKVVAPLPKPKQKPLPELDILDETIGEDINQASEQPVSKAEAPVKTAKESSDTDNSASAGGSKPKKFVLNFQELIAKWPFNRQQTIIGAVVVLLFLSGLVVVLTRPTVKSGVYVSHRPIKPKPKITTVESTLSGLQVDPSVNKRPVTAIMIENSQDARPQSGLDQASVVFEALAEGGVTRFMGLFQDTQPDYIGPVRSARPYYVQWAFGFDAGYAHVGGSPDGLADIQSWGVRDLDEFVNAGAYHRINNREAPHNVYTSIADLNQLEQSKGYTSSTFTGFARKKEAASKAPNATSIDMTFSGPIYNGHFDYDAKTNSYLRSEGGEPHMAVDANGTQTQINPKVVIGMVVPESIGDLDASGAYYSNYNPIGSGQAFVFQDGIVTSGTWNKSANNGALTFTDANGQPLKLNPGRTWISAVIASSDVTYK